MGFLVYGVPLRYRENHPFVQELRELGYVEGRNLSIEWRDAEGRLERLPALAAELVKSKVDAMVALGTQATAAAQKASAVVPVVMVGVSDPVRDGFVKTLARPGSNITGSSNLIPDLYKKHLEIIRSVRPTLARVAMLVESAKGDNIKGVQAAALTVGMSILPVEAKTGAEIPGAISTASREKAEAILVGGGLFNSHSHQIAELALQHRLITISAFPAFPAAGGLMSYGENRRDSWRRAAAYVDKILKGTRPADLPVEQPTRFDMVVNMKTAKSLGITIPPMVMVQVTQVIE